MAEKDLNTEQKILEAARLVFTQKGFEGARMQEIADKAGINKAFYTIITEAKTNYLRGYSEKLFLQWFHRLWIY